MNISRVSLQYFFVGFQSVLNEVNQILRHLDNLQKTMLFLIESSSLKKSHPEPIRKKGLNIKQKRIRNERSINIHLDEK